ncbi:uncharacterized protein LOC112455691 [Temnothorax curvispinosus]|uniref:Uncharacterized protein LOC112455691 n=1 Tax=Temnothorax curvispinosus TaxID=300111 RepID=A0A6J1PWF2_9HYME|nr:uncharacterized protein LOC112455691 [Temnothorax curvispinosus]
MFSHRGLFLAVTISLASIVLANVLVQPGYEHQYDRNPRYLQHQSVSQPWIKSPTEQYRADQLPNQESTQYLSGVQTVYPYESNQADARSHVLSYPYHPSYHHYLPRPHHVHFARIGGHGYVRPSVYVGHPQSLMVHNRRKRSDSASTKSSKSEVVAHDKDVTAKSPLTDAKHPTTIDSLLPEHEPTDTTEKRVENRQINDYVTNPRSFGFYTENMHPGRTYNMPFAKTMQSMIQWFYTNHYTQPSYVAQDEEIINMNTINTAEPSQHKTLQIPFYSEMTPKAYQYTDTAATPTSVQSQPPFVTYVQNPYIMKRQQTVPKL